MPAGDHLRSLTLSAFRAAATDPTTAWHDGVFWRATWTPDGPGTVALHFADNDISVEAYGPGGEWLASRAHDLTGAADPVPFVPAHHTAVERASQRWRSLRLGRSHSPYHELLPAVLGQRVTGKEAASQWVRLSHLLGPSAPGPLEMLQLPPDPDRLSRLAYHDLHHLGIERRRADALRNVARRAHWLVNDVASQTADTDPSALTSSLLEIPGVGPWTAAVAGGLAFGDPDALLVGDFHVKNTVAWALRGAPRGTDEEMVRDLEPYGGQRHRVVRWLELDGWRAPRRGPSRRNLNVARL